MPCKRFGVDSASHERVGVANANGEFGDHRGDRHDGARFGRVEHHDASPNVGHRHTCGQLDYTERAAASPQVAGQARRTR